jgi:hypothetical protein
VAAAGSAASLLAASPENVDAFLKAVGRRFAALGLTPEQALELNILQGLSPEQRAVLSASQEAGLAGDAAAAAPGAAAARAADKADGGGAAAGDADADADAGAGPAVSAALAALEDDDELKLASILEADAKPPLQQLDEATTAALLHAMADADANFNAFTYGFFSDDPVDAGPTTGLLGELEPGGGGDGALEPEGGLAGGDDVCDLSALADFEPLDAAALASWGSVDAATADGGTLSALAAATQAAAAAGAAAAGEGAARAAASEQDKPAGAEPAAEADAASTDLASLSLGAGFD